MNQTNKNYGNEDLICKPEMYAYPSTRSEVKFATISKNGAIFFSKAAAEEFELNSTKYNYCFAGYDAMKGVICLKFLVKSTLGSSNIIKNRSGIKIHRPAFFHHNNIDLAKVANRYFVKKIIVEEDPDSNWLGIYLNNPIKRSVTAKTKVYTNNVNVIN